MWSMSNKNGFTCGTEAGGAEWPVIFAWTGNGYSEVSDQHKDYYRNYLKSLETWLAAYSPLKRQAAAAAQTAGILRRCVL